MLGVGQEYAEQCVPVGVRACKPSDFELWGVTSPGGRVVGAYHFQQPASRAMRVDLHVLAIFCIIVVFMQISGN